MGGGDGVEGEGALLLIEDLGWSQFGWEEGPGVGVGGGAARVGSVRSEAEDPDSAS